MSSLAVHPLSAKILQHAFLKPCAEVSRGKPAALHQSRNALPKPAGVNGAPVSVTRNVMAGGTASSARASSGVSGMSPSQPVFCWTTWIAPLRTCWRPMRNHIAAALRRAEQ